MLDTNFERFYRDDFTQKDLKDFTQIVKIKLFKNFEMKMKKNVCIDIK